MNTNDEPSSHPGNRSPHAGLTGALSQQPLSPFAVSRASDSLLKDSVYHVFGFAPEPPPLAHPSGGEPTVRRRELLHDWPLSRVERIIFRSEHLPTTILKYSVPPMHSEGAVYSYVLKESTAATLRQWAPTFYGQYTPPSAPDQLWLFLEDLGNRRLSDEPTTGHLDATIVTLAQMHAAFTTDAQPLAAISGLPAYDLARYLKLARQTYLTTQMLAENGQYPAVDAPKLEKLLAVCEMYNSIAIELAAAPLTFVHGDFQPHNIMLVDDEVRFIDWSNACFGVGLTDLVDLATFVSATSAPDNPTDFAEIGFDSDAMSDILHRYCAAYEDAGGVRMQAESVETLFVACQIQKKLWQIHWFNQCATRWIPSGSPFYNDTVAASIDHIYALTRLFK